MQISTKLMWQVWPKWQWAGTTLPGEGQWSTFVTGKWEWNHNSVKCFNKSLEHPALPHYLIMQGVEFCIIFLHHVEHQQQILQCDKILHCHLSNWSSTDFQMEASKGRKRKLGVPVMFRKWAVLFIFLHVLRSLQMTSIMLSHRHSDTMSGHFHTVVTR